MSENDKKEDNAKSKTLDNAKAIESKLRSIGFIWLIPLIALLITGILIWDNTINKGPTIELHISKADGLVEGTTLVKTRSVPVGRVEGISLSKDYKEAIVKVQMYPNTDDLIKKDSQFWIVKPRVENTGISGLDTLLSGAYIEMRRGVSEDEDTSFELLEEPPLNTDNNEGMFIELASDARKKLNKGDVVLYKGVMVGSVTSSTLDFLNRSMSYQIFIKYPYTKLLNSNTKFWISSGIDISFDADGFKLNTESLDSIIKGGIAFDNIRTDRELKFANNEVHTLYADYNKALLSSYSNGVKYVIMVKDTIKGLKIGSPVYFKGIKVGEVSQCPWYKNEKYDVYLDEEYIPIMISINVDYDNKESLEDFLDKKIASKRLCSSISLANPLTGENRIDLSYTAEKCYLYSKKFRDLYVIPSLNSGNLIAEMQSLIANLNKIDTEGISNNLNKSLESLNKALDTLTNSAETFNKKDVLGSLKSTLDSLNETIKGYGPKMEINQELLNSIKNLNKILDNINPATTVIGQDPSALFFNKDKDPDVIPRKSHEK